MFLTVSAVQRTRRSGGRGGVVHERDYTRLPGECQQEIPYKFVTWRGWYTDRCRIDTGLAFSTRETFGLTEEGFKIAMESYKD